MRKLYIILFVFDICSTITLFSYKDFAIFTHTHGMFV